jgi:hypothetical protein
MGKDQSKQIYVGFVADIDIKILGVPTQGLGMPFLSATHAQKFFISARVFFPYDVIHRWMTGRMDGWKAS